MVAVDVSVELADPAAPCTWSVDTSCSDCWDTLSPDLQQAGIEYAAMILWSATGRQYGLCPSTVRPCGKECCSGGYGMYWSGGTWMPYILNGVWRNCWCGANMCECEPDCQVYLPGPVASVTTVTVDGALIPASAWRVDNKKWLVRTDGLCWPTSQDFNIDSGPNTMSVTYMKGIAIPASLASATGTLAGEFAKACQGGPCRLPQRLSTIARQGVQLTFVDVDTLLQRGLTGLTEVDQVIMALNPSGLKRPLRVYSPDLPITRQVSIP